MVQQFRQHGDNIQILTFECPPHRTTCLDSVHPALPKNAIPGTFLFHLCGSIHRIPRYKLTPCLSPAVNRDRISAGSFTVTAPLPVCSEKRVRPPSFWEVDGKKWRRRRRGGPHEESKETDDIEAENLAKLGEGGRGGRRVARHTRPFSSSRNATPPPMLPPPPARHPHHETRCPFFCVIPLLHPLFLPASYHSRSSSPFARSRERMTRRPPDPGGDLCTHADDRLHNEDGDDNEDDDDDDFRGWTYRSPFITMNSISPASLARGRDDDSSGRPAPSPYAPTPNALRAAYSHGRHALPTYSVPGPRKVTYARRGHLSVWNIGSIAR